MVKDSYLEIVQNTIKANYYNVAGVKELEVAKREVVDLVNDVIDYWPRKLSSREFTELAAKSAFLFSTLHIIWPLSNGVFIDLLEGNLPACFMQLRLIVETATKALYADYEYRLKGVSVYNIEELEKAFRKEKISLSKFYQEKFSKMFGEEVAKLALSL